MTTDSFSVFFLDSDNTVLSSVGIRTRLKDLSFVHIPNWFLSRSKSFSAVVLFPRSFDFISSFSCLELIRELNIPNISFCLHNIHFNNFLKFKTMYVVTLFDARSTQENPVKPITAIVDNDGLFKVINDAIDEHHYLVINLANDINSILKK